MGVFELQTLPNGLQRLTAPMDHSQSVSCSSCSPPARATRLPRPAGSRTSPSTCSSRAPRDGPTARDIGYEIDGIGGEFNAFTGKEYTGYYVRCAGEHREVALDVLVDMLRHSKFDPEEVDREKGVIVEEMNMYFDTPRDYIGGVYDSLLYGDQPLGWDIIGRKETCARRHARRSSTTRATEKPARMVVGIAGKIDPASRPISTGCSATCRPTRRASRPRCTRTTADRVKIHTKASDQAHLVIGARSHPLVILTATRSRC